jgi:hypothetical protein
MMDNVYKSSDKVALYNRNQGFLKRFFPLDVRLRLKKLVLIIKDPKPFFERKRLIRKSLRLQKPSQSISTKGFSELYGKELPFYDEVFNYWVLQSKKLINDKMSNESDYSKNLLTSKEILMHKATRNFALSHEVLSIIGKYLGTAPSLHSVNLWWGRAGELGAGSPFFHLDSLDTSCIRMYLYLSDVGEGDGPFCVIPKKESLSFVRKTGYLGNSLSDETVFKEIPLSSLKILTGIAGSIFAIDATNSLHYGSRCAEGDRVAMIFSYASYFNDDQTASLLESLPKISNPSTLQEMAYEHISVK